MALLDLLLVADVAAQRQRLSDGLRHFMGFETSICNNVVTNCTTAYQGGFNAGGNT